ncbi:hypothetical protein FBU30_010472 [Linnemannia zychae]|nr:hypothetical protein FBU30_010472 [Linnemannia zychae]
MDSTHQQEQAIAAALQQQHHHQHKQHRQHHQSNGQPQEQQQSQDEQQTQQQQQQQFQQLSLHSANDTLNHDVLSDRNSNGSALHNTISNNANEQLILQHTGVAASNLLHHHNLSDHQATSHALQSSHNRSDDSTSTAAAAAAAAAATAATIASLESLDSVVAEAVVAASKSTVTSSINTSTTATTPSVADVAAVAAIATGTSHMPSVSTSSAHLTSSNGSSSSSSSSNNLNNVNNNSPSITNTLALENRSGHETTANGERYDKCPVIFKWPADSWESWLDQEKTFCRWNMVRHRHRDKQTFARGPTASEWTREFQCDHAGQYRDRKNPNIDPSKKRKRNGSIKCNCPAFIKMRKQFHEEEVSIEYSWKHEGHIPNVMEDIKAQRLPQDLKAWIKERVHEGLDWKTVKNLMNSGSAILDELHPATKQNIKVLLPSSYALFANTSRQLKNKNSPKSASSPGSDRMTQNKNTVRFDEKASLTEQLSQPSSPRSAQHSFSPTSSQEIRSSSSQTQRHNTDVEEATRAPQPSGWQIVSLESTQSNSSGHGLPAAENIHTNSPNHDSQTIAVHTITPSGTTQTSAHSQLQHQVLAISEPLLNAESISRVIREQRAAQDIATLSMVTNTGASTTSASGQTDNAVANMLYSGSSRERSGMQGGQSGSKETNPTHQSASNTLLDQSSSMEDVRMQGQDTQAVALQQRMEQHVQERSPRDMMLEVLRAIADLHKQMEATEQYGTQEDAMKIIESFANPIRLMKEALERRSSNS